MGPKPLFQDLDWPKLLEATGELARTPYGKKRIFELLDAKNFAQTLERAKDLQTETFEIGSLLERQALLGPLTDLQNIDDELETLSKSGVLEISSLVKVRAWLYCFDSWNHFPKDLAGKHFKAALVSIFDPHECLRHLDRVLTPTGELSERASPKLGTLFSQARDLKREISARLDALTRDYGAKGLLQERYSDVRDGRYVLPVKVSEQNQIEGRIAEFSVSKQTVFIEPKEVELLQSKLRRVEAETSQEIFAILLAVAKQLKPFAGLIEASVQVVGYWDAVQARAQVAKRYGGRMIQVNSDREWLLQESVNPILFWNLPADQIVRNTIELTGEKQMILLSGPNTGGKTVLLKTLGLSAVCARTGFFFPTLGAIKVPFFDEYFIDLGDPQSIEEHVSSFSGHVLKMKRILEGVTDRSLILVDEMNSATDPEEGAAIALAFVETILEKPGAVLIATTHDPKLKAMGIADARVLNASIIFNEETLKPTYRVVFGAPGRSRAIETAERLGLPKGLLDRARAYLTDEHKVLESVLAQLQDQLGTVERARAEANHFKEEAEKLKLEWEERVKVTVNESLEKARQKLKHVLELAQIEVRETLKKIQSTKTHKQLDDLRRELNESFERGEQRIETAVIEASPELSEALGGEQLLEKPKEDFEKGAWVRVPKWKNVGEIIEWDGKKAKVALGAKQQGSGFGKAFIVSVYPMEMERLSERELRAVLGVRTGPGAASGLKSVTIQSVAVEKIPDQLDIRGQRLDDAMRETSAYLDLAFRSGRGEVTIIHGLGTGALREGVRALLKGLNYVAVVQDAGSSGATLVRFSN